MFDFADLFVEIGKHECLTYLFRHIVESFVGEVYCMVALVNNKKLMGDLKAGKWLNEGLWTTFLFSLVTVYIGIIGIFESLSNIAGA